MFSELPKIISLFNKYKVEYLIIGGYAVNLYGYPRMTEDIDILFKKGKSNGERLESALREFGIETDIFSGQDFSLPIHFRIGEIPNSIDLINATAGIDLDKVFDNANEFMIEDIKLNVIPLDDLI